MMKVLRKMSNWKSPGPDNVQGFWLKNFTKMHDKLLNNLAICKIHMEQYPEAEEMLTTALEESPGDVDTLVNLVVVSRHLNKPKETVDKWISQLKKVDPNNAKLKEWEQADATFEQSVENFQ